MSLYDCELLSEDEITRLFESKDYTGVHNEMLRMRGLIIQFRLYAGGLGSLRVANRPPSTEETPRDFPAVPPRELYPTSDIRFVLIEIGKLTTSVERLITDIRSQGEKIDDVRHQVSFVKGAWWVLAALLAGIIWMVATKWHTLVAVFQVINK